ncbi:hypothetical protein [Bdellovibrio sp. HCB288]|uniref:hypothetical protein n=1 Tax=Bdellovibrio sp. HCB288 TaxID=3394355 RepID=UPI0039B4A3F2
MARYFERVKLAGISVFIAFNLMIIMTASFPDRSELGRLILRNFGYYIDVVGLEQPWSMFAPNPMSLNSYIEVEILFKDKSIEKWSLPRPTQMAGASKVIGGDRYRKFTQEYLMPDKNEEIWFDVARYVTRNVNQIESQGRKREIEKLQFYRYYNYVKNPTEVFVRHGEPSGEYKRESVFFFHPANKEKYEISHNN